MKDIYNVIGLMSGTSLDGLDVAYCRFELAEGKWDYKILCANTYGYSDDWRRRLSTLENATALEYARCNVDLGHYFGKCVCKFLTDNGLDATAVDFVSSHGHTVFHQPEIGLTTQIADPNTIAAETGLPVVADFRTLDVALGGQGAPLVPIGDSLLFGDYDSCLNFGGIANISFRKEGRRVAFDISPCNMILNYLSAKMGKPYDEDGQMAKSGRSNESLLKVLNELEYYKLPYPKSLGKEWFVEKFRPYFEKSTESVPDLLATATEHIAEQIAKVLNDNALNSVMVTGGGAFNSFLIESVRKKTDCRVEVANKLIVNYKEAMIFAFLGVLRMRGEANCLSSVTGASRDNCGGVVSGLTKVR